MLMGVNDIGGIPGFVLSWDKFEFGVVFAWEGGNRSLVESIRIGIFKGITVIVLGRGMVGAGHCDCCRFGQCLGVVWLDNTRVTLTSVRLLSMLQ